MYKLFKRKEKANEEWVDYEYSLNNCGLKILSEIKWVNYIEFIYSDRDYISKIEKDINYLMVVRDTMPNGDGINSVIETLKDMAEIVKLTGCINVEPVDLNTK